MTTATIQEQLTSLNVIPATNRFKALDIIDACGESHIKESFAFRIGGWINAKLIGSAGSLVRYLEREGHDVKHLDAKTVRALMLGPDGDDSRLPQLQAIHATLVRVAAWGKLPRFADTLSYMSKPGKESRINRELLAAAMKMRKKQVKDIDARVDQLLQLDAAKDQASARELAAAAPNVLWMIDHVFGSYDDEEIAMDKASDEFVAELDDKLLINSRKLGDEAMLNAVRGMGDWSLGDIAVCDALTEQLESL